MRKSMPFDKNVWNSLKKKTFERMSKWSSSSRLILRFLYFRKDEIERLRRDLGYMQRSNVLSHSNAISHSSIPPPLPPLPPPPPPPAPTNALQQAPKSVAQQDIDYVRIVFSKNSLLKIFHILCPSLYRKNWKTKLRRYLSIRMLFVLFSCTHCMQ